MKCDVRVEQGTMFGDPYPVGYGMYISINGEEIGSTVGEVDKALLKKVYEKGFQDGAKQKRKIKKN